MHVEEKQTEAKQKKNRCGFNRFKTITAHNHFDSQMIQKSETITIYNVPYPTHTIHSVHIRYTHTNNFYIGQYKREMVNVGKSI